MVTTAGGHQKAYRIGDRYPKIGKDGLAFAIVEDIAHQDYASTHVHIAK
jgi:hypothetical protein